MNAPAVASSLSGRRLGRYEVLTQLASGGMAGVYVARAQGVAGFERLVAVKVLHPHLAHEEEFISMFLDEARLAARIRHPNVVATLDISDTEGAGYFLVMEYVEGDHLGALLRSAVQRGQRLPIPTAVRVVHDALNGLGAAHSLRDERGELLNLVHRDISPHNILVGVDGIARLTDFGVAKAEVRLSSTREGQFKGKLSYMAPEHASTGQADQRSDLFSMGILLWECLTGQRLFRAENNAATLSKILYDPIPKAASIVPELAPFDPLLDKAMARPPEERFQTADEFIEALEEAAQGGAGMATTRQVSSVVKQLVGDKVAQEHERVRKSIEDLGHSGIGEALMPLPLEGSGSHVSLPRAADPDDATRAARPGRLAERAIASRRRTTWLVAALIVGALLLGGTVAALVTTPTAPTAGREPATIERAGSDDDTEIEATDLTGATPDIRAGEPDHPARAVADAEAGSAAAAQPAPVTEEPTAGEADPDVDTEELNEAPPDRRAERRRRARIRRATQRMQSTPAERPAEAEDDLLANPYRR